MNYPKRLKPILNQPLCTPVFLIKVSTLSHSNSSILMPSAWQSIKEFTVSQVKQMPRHQSSIPGYGNTMNFPSKVRNESNVDLLPERHHHHGHRQSPTCHRFAAGKHLSPGPLPAQLSACPCHGISHRHQQKESSVLSSLS